MVRTGIPVSVWEQEGEEVIMTAWRVIAGPVDPEPTDDEIRASWGV